MARVISHPGALYGVQRASRRYMCEANSGAFGQHHWIEPGRMYVASALPPHDPDINNSRWWHARYCMECCPLEYSEVPRG